MVVNLVAWKISAPDRPDTEGISNLGELETFLENSDLPRMRSANDIIMQTGAMQHEGQGVYRYRVPGEEWTLLWVAIGSAGPSV